MSSVPYLRLVYSRPHTKLGIAAAPVAYPAYEPLTFAQRVRDGLSTTRVTYAATATCAILAFNSLDRLRTLSAAEPAARRAGLADKAVLVALPLTLCMCIATDVASAASYPWRFWRAVRGH